MPNDLNEDTTGQDSDLAPEPRATLSDKQARGGVIGGKGYGFQTAYIVSRIPDWLGDPEFAQFLQEGAGDVDVRFDRAAGEERWYVQVKNYETKPAKAREVFTQFRHTDAGSPGTYSRFTLACPGLASDLRRLRSAVEELRGAKDFYRPGQAIRDNTWADLENLVRELRLPVDARFLVDKVYFDTDLAGLTDDADLCDLFVGRLVKLDKWATVTREGAERAYGNLLRLCQWSIRQTRSREEIEALIQEGSSPESAEPQGRAKAAVELNATQRRELRDALLSCRYMKYPERRRQVTSDLQKDFRGIYFDSSPDPAIEVAGIIDGCLDFGGPPCLEAFLRILEGYEGTAANTMKAVWAEWKEIAS